MTDIDPPPDSNPAVVNFTVPEMACDSHFHVFPSPDAFPLAAGQRYRPAIAPLASYKAMAQRLGLQRAVLVQPTIYGTDNRLLLDTLAQDRCCRGVCAIDDHTSDAELRALDIVGVCGIRVTSIPGGQAAHDYLRQTAGRIAPLGWHMQLYIGPGLLLKLHRTMADLPVEVVLDHFAGLSAAHAKACDERDALASLLETGRCWIKLSGAYRASLNGPPYQDVQALARWLIAVNEERLVWGSDWPHAHLRGRPMPNDGALLNLLAEQAIDDSQRHRILVDNPAALYRYD